MNIQPFEDRTLEVIALGNLDSVLLDLQSQVTPAGYTLEKALAADRDADALDRKFRDWAEELEIAAMGRSGPVPERLRSEHEPELELESEEPQWRPGDDPELGLASFGKASGSIRDTGEPNSVRKLADGTVLQFDSAGKVSACFPDGSAPDEIAALLQE